MPRGRPPKSTKVLELNGAFKKNPQRKKARAAEPKAVEGVIQIIPADLKDRTVEDACRMILETAPHQVLTPTDQIYVWEMAQLLYASWQGRINASDRQQLLGGLGKLGMNPSDRTRVQGTQKEKPKNRWSDFDEKFKR